MALRRSSQGLSPRVRGSRARQALGCIRPGSIPAGAGEPTSPVRSRSTSGVYPRGCGGAIDPNSVVREGEGLSPRVRGSPKVRRVHAELHGSIPAGAGEPRSSRPCRSPTGVYPRGCGGASFASSAFRVSLGLSPRVRGSQGLTSWSGCLTGSIPAGAGEPGNRRHRPRSGWVYPRGCGGAWACSSACRRRRGLSPRVRGSRRQLRQAKHRAGSIPAGAGEPGWHGPMERFGRVYPRGCGGAQYNRPSRVRVRGLSPRVRGSLIQPLERQHDQGSIPAGAGEPCKLICGAGRCWVYPRGCGGATLSAPLNPPGSGLSPRVRGSPARQHERLLAVGSIPAGAGEPARRARLRPSARVYPRGCGGARWPAERRGVHGGLSPRVRGSL